VTVASTRPERSRRLSRLRSGVTEGRLLTGLLVLAAAVQAVIVLRLVRSSWFGVDAVNYLTTRGPVPSADEGLFRPYGGHWQTIPLLVYRGLFEVFGLGSYLPYVAVALALHIAIVFVLFALLRGVGAHFRTAAFVSALVLFFGGGAEAYMWDAPMVLTAGLLLGLVAALVLVHTDSSGRGQVVAAVLLLAAVMCSGSGLVSAVTVGCFVLFRAGPRAALVVAAPAVAAFSVWFFTIGRDGRVSLGARRIPEIPGFVWSGLTGAVGSVLGVPITGWLLLLALVAMVALADVRSPALRQLAVAGIVGAVTQLVLSSFASLVIGNQAARVGRYQYLVLVLLAPAMAIAIEAVARSALAQPWARRLVPLAAVTLLAVAIGHGITLERRQADFGAASARLYRTWVYGGVQAADAGERQLVEDASTGFNGGRFELFAQPELRRELPSRPPSARTRLDTESEYFVDVGAVDPALFSPTRLISVRGLAGPTGRRPGCHSYTSDGTVSPLVEVTTGRGTEIGITSDSTVMSTQLVRDGVESTLRTWGVAPGAVYVATTAKDAVLRVSMNGSGGFAICHQ
jgi:hypothetical protein